MLVRTIFLLSQLWNQPEKKNHENDWPREGWMDVKWLMSHSGNTSVSRVGEKAEIKNDYTWGWGR